MLWDECVRENIINCVKINDSFWEQFLVSVFYLSSITRGITSRNILLPFTVMDYFFLAENRKIKLLKKKKKKKKKTLIFVLCGNHLMKAVMCWGVLYCEYSHGWRSCRNGLLDQFSNLLHLYYKIHLENICIPFCNDTSTYWKWNRTGVN